MTDNHIHIEAGPYTVEWVREFVSAAQKRGLSGIRLLEHCYRFREFAPMYEAVRAYSAYQQGWYERRVGVFELDDYLKLVERARRTDFPIRVEFGLEVCYFPEQETLVKELKRRAGLDFFIGSVHFIDGFAFDHRADLWDGVDVDAACRRYWQTAGQLAESGLFEAMGHPDLFKIFGHHPSFDQRENYAQLAKRLAQSGTAAEENSGAARRAGAEFGMDPALIAALVQAGVPIVTSSDAHCPEDVGEGIERMAGLW